MNTEKEKENKLKIDHRVIGEKLNLFIFDQNAPASPFFLPKGAFVYNALIKYIKELYDQFGYQEVITPQILSSELWKKSGHYEKYKENMFFSNFDNQEFVVKPMNCPCHMLMYSHRKYSYRDLPLRYADFGRLHRYESSGSISGLTRVRSFCQDDAHIFLPINLVEKEINNLLAMFFLVYEQFGFDDIKISLSTRPPERIGEDHIWDKAENILKETLDKCGKEYSINSCDGAFYGPKIDIRVSDSLMRYHQLGTIQLDFILPEKFDLSFVTSDNKLERPVVIHRALLGSLERFLGVYIEHINGVFPFWLAPTQMVIVPINNSKHLEYCNKIKSYLNQQGNFRIEIDDRNESIAFKTREIQGQKIPFMLVVGDKEIFSNTYSVRKYGESKSIEYNLSELVQMFNLLEQSKIRKY
jgi:threonyl-tRNA synthetase